MEYPNFRGNLGNYIVMNMLYSHGVIIFFFPTFLRYEYRHNKCVKTMETKL